MDIPPATRFIQAAGADNAKIAEMLLQQHPECRDYIVHAICICPKPGSACFEFLKKEATQKDLADVEKELKTLIENSSDSRKTRENAESLLECISRERARRVLKPDQPAIEL